MAKQKQVVESVVVPVVETGTTNVEQAGAVKPDAELNIVPADESAINWTTPNWFDYFTLKTLLQIRDKYLMKDGKIVGSVEFENAINECGIKVKNLSAINVCESAIGDNKARSRKSFEKHVQTLLSNYNHLTATYDSEKLREMLFAKSRKTASEQLVKQYQSLAANIPEEDTVKGVMVFGSYGEKRIIPKFACVVDTGFNITPEQMGIGRVKRGRSSSVDSMAEAVAEYVM